MLGLLALGACGGDDLLSTPVVTLIDAGAEPRQELRLSLTDGQELTSTTTNQVIEQSTDGQSLIEPQPVETITTSTVTRVAVDDGFQVASEITDAGTGPETDPALAEFIGNNLSALIGVTTTVIVDDRGFVSVGENDTDKDLANELLADAINLSNPLPEEAVGVGGSWLTETTIRESGLVAAVETTSTVVEFTENGVVLDIAIVQMVEGLGEEVDVGDSRAVIELWDVTGGGMTELDFSQFTPVVSTINVDALQRFAFPEQGGNTLEQRALSGTVIETVG